jgi:hypothetical protein
MTDSLPRRLKTYTGSQGYVYQYYFVGARPALPADCDEAATEYIFDVTSDRKTTYSVSIFLPDAARQEWAQAHSRALNDAEQYAAVKMRLFQAFDEIENMMANGRKLYVEYGSLEQSLKTLGVA